MFTVVRNGGNGNAEQAVDATPTQNRLRISQRTINNAKATARAAIDGLNLAAEVTEAVPYLGAMSKALTTFKEVLDEVERYKDDCRLAKKDAEEIKSIIGQFEAKWVQFDAAKKEALREALTKLGRVVLECIEILEAVNVDSRRLRDRFRHIFKRDEMQESVRACKDKMRYAKEQFSISVIFDTHHLVREIHRRLQPGDAVDGTTASARPIWRLHAAKSIFHGREREVGHAVHLIVTQAPARVAILGPGGIGKTSIALAVLHDPKVKELYGDHRCFVSCEATTTADALIRALVDALGFTIDDNLTTDSTRHRLLSHLYKVSGIICFDNLETPLDTDKNAVDQLLNEIVALPSMALVITSRDTSIPTIRWTSPPLVNIHPFSLVAALATWDDICHAHDSFAEKLSEAVDCVPLAVTLLAHLTSIEGSAKTIWDRWQVEHTDLIRTDGAEHRLHNIGASIELSLKALSYQGAFDVLSIISIFPNGLWWFDASKLEHALNGRLSFNRAITVLKQFSLVYTEGHDTQTCTNVLSLVRHHMQQHHPVSDELFLALADIIPYFLPITRTAYLEAGLRRKGICRELCFHLVISTPDLTDDIEILSESIKMAREFIAAGAFEPHIQSGLHRQLGSALRRNGQYERARSYLSTAIKLDEELGDRAALFADWMVWALTLHLDNASVKRVDNVQPVIEKAWALGRNDDQVWDLDYDAYWQLAHLQHSVNEGQRRSKMNVVRRSGLCSGNDSEVWLHHKDIESSYDRLIRTSSPPWDLSVVLESLRS